MAKRLNAIIAVLLSVACLPVAPLGANAMVQPNDLTALDNADDNNQKISEELKEHMQ
jgi:hypothetical protein